jgi:hypothetical protein
MKKILTILTLASLLAVVSATEKAKADNEVSMKGTVEKMCGIDTSKPGTLKKKPGSNSELIVDKFGEVKVTCNTPGSKLSVDVSPSSKIPSGSASAAIVGGSSGGAYDGLPIGTLVTAPGTVNGDTAFVGAGVSNGSKLLTAGEYDVIVVPTLTAN